MMKPLRLIAVIALVLIGAAAIVPLRPSPSVQVAHVVRGEAMSNASASDCGAVSCTVNLPLVLNRYPYQPPLVIEITQGVQQPDNSVVLIAERPTIARVTLTSTVSHSDVSAWLYGTRSGAALPGSPIAALNNPRTLKSTADRGASDDTFNFQLPTTWASGEIELQVQASNGAGYQYSSESKTTSFTAADPLQVTILPIAYTCDSGGSGTTTPSPPYNYVVDFTYRIYPVPSISLSTHSSISYLGPCTTSGVPDPEGSDWSAMLTQVTDAWWNDDRPDSYYYGLVEIDCSGGCISGIGWVGAYPVAVGFSGIGPSHYGASETHAHEVGHNHGRRHAPGCGAGNTDPAYPYVSGGKGYIGNAAFPNFGFDVGDLSPYPYTTHYDIMGYCGPEWISDYTYEALLTTAQAQAAHVEGASQPQRAFLVSGWIDPATHTASLRPVDLIEVSIDPLLHGEYTLELLDAEGQILATYPFAPTPVDMDRQDGTSTQRLGFYLAVSYREQATSIRVRHGGIVLGTRAIDAAPGAR